MGLGTAALGFVREPVRSPVDVAGVTAAPTLSHTMLHTRLHLTFGLLCLCAFGRAPASAAVIFVKTPATVPLAQQNGATWQTAYGDLQLGLAQAVAGDEIWVAEGSYSPTNGTDRTASFVLKQGVKLRGGFTANQSDPAERSVSSGGSRLSGFIGSSSPSDNSFHVVRGTALTNATVLEGFTIDSGNANGAGNDGIGGGILLINSTPTIAGCILHSNNATKGGAIGRLGGVTTGSSMVIGGCGFINNTATQGAAIYAETSPIALMNSTVVDCVSAAAIQLTSIASTSQFSASILYRNSGGATLEESQFRATSAPLNVSRCCIEGWDNVAPSNATTFASDPHFLRSPLFTFPSPFLLELRGDSPCIDSGECGVGDAADLDQDGNTSEVLSLDLFRRPRVADDPIVANTGGVTFGTTDRGACEFVRPRTILVNHAATGANTGKNWTDAYTDLQSAMNELNDPRTGGQGEIWVAQGTYKPTSTTDATISFNVPSGAVLYGGFAGGETRAGLRNWRTHPTILSGELGPAGPTGNSHHVVVCVSSSPQFRVIDGFTIRDGNATAAEGGGGISFGPFNLTLLSHCLITANTGSGPGSAIRTLGQGLTIGPTITNTAIVGNTATGSGLAGVASSGGGLALDRCLIAGNSSAAPNGGSGLVLTDIPLQSVAPSLANTIFVRNTANGSASLGAQCTISAAGVFIRACAIQGFAGSLPGATISFTFGIDASGGMVDADGADNIFGTADDNYAPTPCSELVDSSSSGPAEILDADEDGNGLEVATDFLLQPGAVDLPIPNAVDSFGRSDIGVVELQSASIADPDLNGDGAVNAADLAVLLGEWDTTGAAFDLTGDCVIDAADLAVLLGAWE